MKIELMTKKDGQWVHLPVDHMAGHSLRDFLTTLDGTETVARIQTEWGKVGVGGTEKLIAAMGGRFRHTMTFGRMREWLEDRGSSLLEATIPPAVAEVFPEAEVLGFKTKGANDDEK